ncbi:MAG: bis(5'-nucleosyl)-tetraphosphatase, symmetrical [Osedax symbiont Rs2]|nr:MAG: bis(5'-nucleosyl)-tetraphosphatase, symmetrical [Osedax symbiont Rs2]
MSTYVIGDIQGCFAELQLLLQKVQFSSRDQVWFVGDLVNRGPDSLKTLRFIKNLGSAAKVVLGNHDLHLLAVYFANARLKRSDTLSETLSATDCEELMLWLKAQPLLHYDQQLNAIMTHAGVPASWSLEQAQSRAREVEEKLQGDNYTEYFQQMYGNQPDLWSDNLQGMERLRCITNYLTRMRFCSQSERLELNYKGEIGNHPSGFQPWFELHHNNDKSPLILFGHWAAIMGQTGQSNILALDTGCVWGEHLSALRLEDLSLHKVASLSRTKPGEL